MEQDNHFPIEITDGVRLSTDFTRSGFGTPRLCAVIMFGGGDLSEDDEEWVEAAS